MKLRSYEFHEVRTNLGRKDEELQHRGNAEKARESFHRFGSSIERNKGAVYLVRVQVLEVIKPEEEEDQNDLPFI